MKATEIMVGDWLHLHYKTKLTGEVDKNFRVGQIRDDYGDLCVWAIPTASTRGNMGALEPEYGSSNISPILLTAEILEKNGFVKEEQKGGHILFCDHNEYREIEIYERSDGNWYITVDDIEFSLPLSACFVSYVHELQHFLRLCVHDREIILLD